MNGSIYTQIARNAIQEHYEGISIDRDFYLSTYPELSQKKACFVTLTLNNRLRGCIGSIIAHQSLLDDLTSNARSAAFHDPRFPPLSQEEFSHLSIEVSLLTHPEPVEYSDRVDLERIIRPYVDGIILRLGKYQATFLPQVWDELSDFESFFSHLGMKAGIGNNPLSYHPDIYTYQVQKFEEQSHD